MNRRGFTLVEIIVVMAVIGILLSMATFQFTDYLKKAAIERQTKEIYADLMVARSAAVTQQIPRRVRVTPSTFTFISSAGGNRALSNTITWSGKASSDTATQIVFDQRGTFNIDVSSGNTTICVEPTLDSAQYDSIVVFSTRIHLGKRSPGEVCNSDNIAVK